MAAESPGLRDQETKRLKDEAAENRGETVDRGRGTENGKAVKGTGAQGEESRSGKVISGYAKVGK